MTFLVRYITAKKTRALTQTIVLTLVLCIQIHKVPKCKKKQKTTTNKKNQSKKVKI